MRKRDLDTNATTKMRDEAPDAMLPFCKDVYGNASSIHQFGRAARVAVDKARQLLAGLLGASSPEEIIFTSGGTESDNFAIKGAAHALGNKGNHIITSAIEHSAVLNTARALEKNGYRVTYLPVDGYGLISLDDLKRAITDKTVLISIMYANNEVGAVEPISEIGAVARERGIYFHTDAVQAVGKAVFAVKDLPVDLVSMSAHKIYGPKGVGAIYIKKGTRIDAIMHGGHHEMNKRAGTENVPGIVGLGRAAELAGKEAPEEIVRLRELRDYLCKGIASKIAHTRINGDPDRTLPNTANIGFKYLEGESIMLNLDMEGIAVSTGSACTSGTLEPSHVLTAMGIDAGAAQGSIRFSLGRDNTKEDIDYVLEVLPPIIQRLRDMSPLYEKS